MKSTFIAALASTSARTLSGVSPDDHGSSHVDARPVQFRRLLCIADPNGRFPVDHGSSHVDARPVQFRRLLCIADPNGRFPVAAHAVDGRHAVAGVECEVAQDVFFRVDIRAGLEASRGPHVSVSVNEPRRDEFAGNVDHLRAGRNIEIVHRAESRDPPVLHHEHGIFDRRAVCPVHHGGANKRLQTGHGLRWRRTTATGDQEHEQQRTTRTFLQTSR